MLSRLDPYALVGSMLGGRYALEAFVGVGRYSAVYRATDAQTHAAVAVRLLKVRTNLAASKRDDVVRRLRGFVPTVQDVARECSAFAGMLDVGALVTPEGRWMPAIVQPWLVGETLEVGLENERWRSAAPPSRTLGRAIEWMTPVADALTYAHARGLVHGSIAPRNIFVRPDPDTALDLLDLGMVTALTALQTQDSAFAPSHEGPIPFFPSSYASPEHFLSLRAPAGLGLLGPASDVFSLALLMVELLTGRAPLGDGDDSQLEAAALDPAVRPTPRARGRDLGGYLEAIFERALAVKPADRHGTVESFWSAIRAASRLTLRPSAATPAPVALPAATTLPTPAPPPPSEISPAPEATARPTPPEEIVTRAAMPSFHAVAGLSGDRDTPPCDTVLHGSGRATGAATTATTASSRPACTSVRPEVTCTPSIPTRPLGTAEPAAPPAPAPREEEDDLAIGQIIAGKYAVERLLGRGGMGAVWRCTHLGLQERVAVKVMSRKMADNPEIRARFAREARASAKIKSRFVARVYDTGELPDLRPYFVMEYMEGETLAQALQGGRAMSLEDTVRILGQVGRGLARAHEHGIVHRDVKPENVFLADSSDDGLVAKVFDFGIVKVTDAPSDGETREGLIIGTPNYMSPEQADGLPIDARSDIYSVGLMAFRMLTGKRPFDGDSIMTVLLKICTAPLPSIVELVPGLPPSIDGWFQHACARDRKRRFATAIECVDAFASAAGVEGLRDSILPAPPSTEVASPGTYIASRTSRASFASFDSLPAPASIAPQSADLTPGPHELSCPTLLDEMPEVLDDDEEPEHASFLLVTQKRSSFAPGFDGAPVAVRRTNPLFGGGDVTPSSGTEALGGVAMRRRSRLRRSRAMLAFSGVAVACALGTAAVTGQLTETLTSVASGNSLGEETRSPPAAPPRATAAEAPVPPPSQLSGAIIERAPIAPATVEAGLASPARAAAPPPPPPPPARPPPARAASPATSPPGHAAHAAHAWRGPPAPRK